MIIAPSSSILACATCMADKGSLIGQAQGFAILFMLIVLAFMFACAACIVYTMVRRQRTHSQLEATA
ncbi:hypothetical protein [Prosthecobacter vanneervenii]|uniref:Flagellar basal body-associated protein FliL n=1 Tax=Prosthecobacter vanneervenii TaxID=48466 RepID=A0A7W7YEH4_9BACT|nr:hypothetical protein [Prosthecobacter vanneervenii]MBB5034542.1 flagellar basal body-associated protein FliL [Prosthecobacter vanneervenii]